MPSLMTVPTNAYPQPLHTIRQHYPNLEGQTYLDHAGTTIYSSLLLDRIHEQLRSTLLANPHSQSLPSKSTENMVDETRLKVLDLFNADPMYYDVAFTLNSTHAIKIAGSLISDSFAQFTYYYNIHSHTSLIGLREVASEYHVFEDLSNIPSADHSGDTCLVSWPGQSNFNGLRLPMSQWNNYFKSQFPGNCYTLFDAASLSTSSPPDLSHADSSPDFVVVSFYKIFGLPDIGGLIFKKNPVGDLVQNRKYFGGGTLDALAADSSFRKNSRQLHTSLEDGTIPIHSILELSLAIDVQKELYGSFENIRSYTRSLRDYAVEKLQNLKYKGSDVAMVELHEKVGPSYGPIIALSLLDKDSKYVGYYNFEKLSSLKGISIRTGTLCNIGGIQTFLHRTADEIERDYKRGHKCGDQMDILEGKPTGAIRISFGAMTLKSEIDKFISYIQEFMEEPEMITNSLNSNVSIVQLMIYPIKSCPGYSIPKDRRWKVSKEGFEFDREFIVMNLLDEKPMVLKNYTRMSFVRCDIEPEARMMVVANSLTGESIEVNIDIESYHLETVGEFEVIKEERVINFLSELLGVRCSLAKSRTRKQMQNKSAILVVNLKSLEEITEDRSLISRFRANIVVDSKYPFMEDHWERIIDRELGLELDKVCDCDRCHMVTITSEGNRDPKLLLELAKKRKRNGKVYFGVNMEVRVGGEIGVGSELSEGGS